MNGFATLFRKEVRFLATPAILFFLFVHVPIRIGLYLLNFKFDHFYHQNVLDHLDEATLMNTFIWNPILSGNLLNFMYAALLVYALIHGLNSRSKIQVYMLPVRRMTQLLTTFCAFSFWVIVFHAFLPIVYKILIITFIRYEALLTFPYSALLIGEISDACDTLALASTAMLCFTVVVYLTYRWWRYMAGVMAGLAGYVIMIKYIELFEMHVAPALPGIQLPGKQMVFMNPGMILSHASITVIFVIASMFLYDRFGEV